MSLPCTDATETMAREGDPPLIPGTVHGLRTWRVFPEGSSDRVRLCAISQDVLWPPGEALTAVCQRGKDHRAPSPKCSCGIYAHHPTRAAIEDHWDVGYQNVVVGLVECSGRLEVHAEGFRAEHARLHSIVGPSGDLDPGYEALAEQVAASYGVELLLTDSPAELDEHCRVNGIGLSTELVLDLIERDAEVVVEPHACGFLNRRGRAVGGTGYRLREQEEQFTLYGAECEAGRLGARLLRVAGTRFHADALQGELCEPGRALHLVPEPGNPHDSNAVAVWDEQRTVRLGYVPRRAAREMGAWIDAGRLGQAVSIWQWRDLRTGERIGLHVLASVSRRIKVASARVELDEEIPF